MRSADDADVVVLSIDESQLFEKTALQIESTTGKRKYVAGIYAVILLHTGMRCGELLALRWSDIDFETGLLTIEKSRSVAKDRKPSKGTKYKIHESDTKKL